MKIILSGFLFGLTIAFSFGPGFWAMIQTTINKGLKSGILFLSGFFLSDITFMLIALFSVKSFTEELVNSIWLGIIASIILMVFGIFSIIKKKEIKKVEVKKEIPLYLKHIGNILRGYIFNTSNPFNLLFWLGVITMSSRTYGLKSADSYIFIASILTTTIFFDVIKCFFASKLQYILNEKILFLINKFVGVIMIFCSCFIFWKMCL